VARARTAAAKQARREEILATAGELLASERYDALTMSSVARGAGVAKGTLYLYWATKEELFLEALQDEYARFLAELAAAVRAGPAEVPAVAARVAAEVVAHPRLAALVGILHAVLERNASVDAIVAFKRALLAGGAEVAAALCERLPWLGLGPALQLLLRLHGAMVAFRQMADPPPMLALALRAPELSVFRVDIERDLRELVHDLLIAAKERTHG
jgi:AcrR family transcriptional regulator